MKMTISKKLFAGFISILVILAITVVISYIQIKSVDATYGELIDDKAHKLILIKELDLEIKQQQKSLRSYLLVGDDASLQSFEVDYETYFEVRKKLDEIIVQPKAKELLKELDGYQEKYLEFAELVFEEKRENNIEGYTKLLSTQGIEIATKFDDKIAELTEYQQKLLDVGNEETTKKVNTIVKVVVALGVFALLAGIIIAFYISRIISKPLINISSAAEKISAGDLTVEEISVKNKDEIGELAIAFNRMAQNLRDMIQHVGFNAEQVAASAEQLTASAEQSNYATKQIAETMQGVAVGIDKQVHSVEETSETINEMTIGIQQIANNAQNVSAQSYEASEKAANGGQSIKSAVQQMNSINSTFNELAEVIKGLGIRSGEIGKILEVITGIAGQTNLLALNAAIEAARAGEHGRGFAVVADEVRKLAEQSAVSAQQISHLISSIQEETQKAVETMETATSEVLIGIETVNMSGKSFEQIEESVNEVTTQIQEVSSAVQQIAAASEQIVSSVQLISEVAESSASGTQEVSASTEEQLASMEEISSSSRSLADMAEELQSLISKFKI